jgi:hypothetical protein
LDIRDDMEGKQATAYSLIKEEYGKKMKQLVCNCSVLEWYQI